MVQLSMLAETGAPTLAEVVASLDVSARAAGAGREAVCRASRASERHFGDEFGCSPLTTRQMTRVADYHRAVIRRTVFAIRATDDRRYRDRARAVAAAGDLMSAGIRGEALRAEMEQTLGIEASLVDYVLERMVGAA